MAFGDILATGGNAAITLANPQNALSANMTVAAGDLVVVTYAERASRTSTAIQDNLTNSWTELFNNDGGNVANTAWWSVITNAGTITSINITTTASNQDFASSVVRYEGPFTASPQDVNPTGSIDATSPFTTTPSGTLAQADELVVGYFSNGNGVTYSSPTPTGPPAARLDKQNASGTGPGTVSVALVSLVVASTSSVTLGVSGTASTQGAHALVSFKKDTGAKTLTAGSGSFAVTGTAASLKLGRKIAAGAGSFSFTGTAASLEYGYRIAADAGSFTVTGTAATLKHGYKLTVDAGSFVFTGSDATLTRSGGAKTLPADAGAFVFTGTAAALEVGYKIAAEAGSFTFTGTAASLERGYKIAANAGAFSFTGSDAALSAGANKMLAAGSGAFAFTGTAASLKWGHKVAANAGTFTYTGTAATLQRGHPIIANAGAFAFTGSAASLETGRVIIPSIGTFIFTGSDASLIAGTIPPPRVPTERRFRSRQADNVRPSMSGQRRKSNEYPTSGRDRSWRYD